MADNVKPFGTRRDGREVQAITLDNGTLRATVLTHGAVLQSLRLKDVAHNLTLGFPDLASYDGKFPHFGSVIAPVANRIGGAQAVIDGETCHFSQDIKGVTLHSGPTSSQHDVWTLGDHGPDFVTLTLDLADGRGGFPGNRHLSVTYRLKGDTLHLDIMATSDRETLMNIAHHGYWNLDGTETWADHSLRLDADNVLAVDPEVILPTGDLVPLDDHPFDFREARRIAPGDIPELDHNFCLAPARRGLTPVLALTGSGGVTMEISTTEPGVQIFGAGTIDTGDTPSLHGHSYGRHCGIAIEPQAWPDAPNHAGFPSITLSPGATYHQVTTFRFTRG
ncbi:aldose epimerase family protein [Oceaniglobus trochenteri]|uniref:aldose epimerase family protein n=1 Tax=Oceaniglobus trochenteri TaxID=2763260 RepID=UPI001CFFD3F5|nr:aldose epimerase family protein [Oceaniglobus trochenteri]